MHIVHVVDHFHPKLGYQETSLAYAHRRLGHRVTVVTSDRQFPFPNYDVVYRPLLGPRIAGPGVEESGGIRIVRLKSRMEMRGFVFVPGITKALRDAEPDVVIHHGLLHPNFFMTALAAARAHWPLVADSHMAVYNTDIHSPAQKAYLGLHRRLLRRFVIRRVKSVAIGPAELRLLGEVLPGVAATLIPLGADADMFTRNEEVRARSRAELGFHPDDIVWLHAGKFQEDKRTLEVVAAFKDLIPTQPRLRLLLVGGGGAEYLARVTAACTGLSGLVRRDLVPHDELPRYLMASDIGIWPGSPSNIFLEAMASGLPLVLQAGEYADFLLQTGNGVTVTDTASLVASVRQLMADPAGLTGMGRRGRERFERDFRWDRIAQRFLNLATA